MKTTGLAMGHTIHFLEIPAQTMIIGGFSFWQHHGIGKGSYDARLWESTGPLPPAQRKNTGRVTGTVLINGQAADRVQPFDPEANVSLFSSCNGFFQRVFF